MLLAFPNNWVYRERHFGVKMTLICKKRRKVCCYQKLYLKNRLITLTYKMFHSTHTHKNTYTYIGLYFSFQFVIYIVSQERGNYQRLKLTTTTLLNKRFSQKNMYLDTNWTKCTFSYLQPITFQKKGESLL